MNLGSNTFGQPTFSKGLAKLAILPEYKCPFMLCLALQPHQKVRQQEYCFYFTYVLGMASGDLLI